MKKPFFFFACFILFFGANAQNDVAFSEVYGKVTECKNNAPLTNVHIINQTSGFATLTDSVGNFTIKGKQGDILKFSYVGFKTNFIYIYAPEAELQHFICMSPDTILLREVTVLPFSNYTQFKQQFMALKVKDTELIIPGVTLKVKTTIHNLDNDDYVKSLGFALQSPISALYYNLSRHQKSIRKYYRLINEEPQQYVIDQKYNREMVTKITGLKDEKLSSFMAFCNFSREYLLTATDYEIAEKIKEKYVLYCEINDCK